MINLELYKEICRSCDDILKQFVHSDEVVAIPFLHVLREHPEWLSQYNFLIPVECNNKEERKVISIKQGMRKLLSPWIFRGDIRRFKDSISGVAADLVIISHLTNIKQCDQDEDEYFGRLAFDVQSQAGIEPVILLINHTSHSSQQISEKLKSDKFKKIILPESAGLFREVLLFIRVLKAVVFYLPKFSAKSDISKNLLKRLFSPRVFLAAISPMRIGKLIQIAIKETGAKCLITTYEGHSRERVIFSSARQASNDIKCFGYQHSILNKYQHAARRGLSKRFDPDCIFSCGYITFDALTSQNSLVNNCFALLGSPKRISTTGEAGCNSSRLTFLFLPEGMESEYRYFFDFFVNCSIMYPNFDFIWRSHPILDLKDLSFFKEVKMPKNCIISDTDFGQDVERANYGVYRGSTAILRAVMGGMIPLYLDKPGEIEIDILYSVNTPKITSPKDLSQIQSSSLYFDLSQARKFCSKYFSLYDPSQLIERMRNHEDSL